ncbi:TPA: TIR domain-containing protein [Bacillus paranthracis]|nr:TIR domain-containing protein [Bacillus paranthracis]
MKKIFISHSTKDGDLAIKFMDMLQSQFNLTRDDFFLTSDEQLTIGGNWIEEIREAMHNASIVLPIITPNFLESKFCICELGAAWVNQHALVPVIIPPLDYNALADTPYRSWVQSITLESEDDLGRIAQAMSDRDLGKISIPRFVKRARTFYNETVIPFISTMEQKEVITPELVKTLREQLNSYKEAYNEVEDEITQIKEENKVLRRMKNAEQVRELDFAKMSEWDTFMNAVDNMKEKLKRLPSLVPSILYNNFKKSIGNGRGFVGAMADNASLEKLENEGYIVLDDEGWEPNFEHSLINKASEALYELEQVMKANKDIIEERFEHEYGDILMGLKYSPFWEKVLGESITHSER